MTSEENKILYMNKNIKAFPPYLAFTWDVIFVWAISTMFFTTQKGLSYSQTIMLDSILMLAGCLMCLPVARLFQNVRSVTATRFGLLGYGGYITLCIIGTNYYVFVIAQFFLAFGYVVNGIKTNMILTESLSLVKRGKDYERVYGKGISIYYIIEAVGAIVGTYLYSWNPYSAYYVSLGIIIFAELYSFLFKNPEKFQESNIKSESITKNKDKEKVEKNANIKIKKPDGYFKLFKMPFIFSLLLFMFIMRGTTSITSSAFKVYLQEAISFGAIPIWAFGYIYAGIRIASAISGKYQFKFNLKYGVKSLIIFVSTIVLGFIINGVVYLTMGFSTLSILIIIISSYLQYAAFAPLRILVNNYLQTCVQKKNVERVYSLRIAMEYLGYAAISFLFASLLSGFNDNYGLTNVVYISILIIPIIITCVMFVRLLIKKHAEKYTVIKDEYTND